MSGEAASPDAGTARTIAAGARREATAAARTRFEAAPPCMERGRRLFYERVGRYFVAPDRSAEMKAFAEGECRVCGETVLGIMKTNYLTCRAQDSLTARRNGTTAAEASGRTERKAANPRGGFFKFGPGCAILIEEHGPATVVVNIDPMRDIPPDLTVLKTGAGVASGLVRDVLTGARRPSLPFLLVLPEQKTDGPFRLSEQANRVYVCGGPSPRGLSPNRIRSALDWFADWLPGAKEKPLNELLQLRRSTAEGLEEANDQFLGAVSKIENATSRHLVIEEIPLLDGNEVSMAWRMARNPS